MSDIIQLSQTLGISAALLIVIIIIAIWSLIWKAFALWKAARKNHLIWFILLLIINTIGILEILYIFIFSELGRKAQIRKPQQGKIKRKR